MSLFGSLARQFKATDSLSWGQIDALWGSLFGGAVQSRSGVAVGWLSALRTTTVLACARVLGEGIAQLPLQVLRVNSDGTKKPAIDLPVYKLLYRRPNDWMTSFELREMMMFHAVLTGNAYAFVNRVRGNILELIPLQPHRVRVHQNADYSIEYRVTGPDGSVETFDRKMILHVRGPTWDGYRGLDVMQMAREAIGLSLAAEQTHAMLHAHGARPSGIVSVNKSLNETELIRLAAWVRKHYGGLDNVSRVMILDNDAKFTPFDMKGVDGQHLETRRFQIEEVCRAMRVFPQMVMHSDKTSTFASADAFFIAHVVHSLSPWVSRWEHTIERDLLADDDSLIAKFNVNGLLRGDAASRGDFYLKALGGARAETAYMTRNEVRDLEDLDPIEGGDTLPIPINPEPVIPAPIGGPDNGPAPVPAPAPVTKPKPGAHP